MTNLFFSNFINGEKICLSGKFFRSNSEYFPKYSIELANSGVFDIAVAIAKAKIALKELATIPLLTRKKFAFKLINSLFINPDIEEHIVMMSGLPLTFVKKELEDVKNIFLKQIERLFEIYKEEDNFLLEKIETNTFYAAKEAIAYVILPLLSIRAISLIFPYSILLGIPLIIKSNSIFSPLLFNIIETLHQLNYPKNCINILSFDDTDPSAMIKHEKLIKNCDIIWTFGDDTNLRYKTIKSPSENAKIDLFSNKTAIRHPYNNCAALVCNNENIEKTINIIMESCITLPFECMALKTLYIVEDCYDEIKDRLIQKFNNLQNKIGNPISETTLVGYFDKNICQSASMRISELQKSGLVKILSTNFDNQNNFIFSPVLMETNDELLDLFQNSFAVIYLVLKKCKNIDDGINMINSAVSEKRLAVTFLGSTKLSNKILLKTNAIHIKINAPTIYPDIMHHDGNDYFKMLTDIKRIIKE